MNAADVMTASIVSVKPETKLLEAVHLMLQDNISGLPVLDRVGNLVGIVTEGDLLRRGELGTERHRPRWIEFLRAGLLAEEYAHTNGRRVAEVMTEKVFTVTEATRLDAVVDLMERRHVKRVPVMRGGKLVGIVSRADLLRALARLAAETVSAAHGDDEIRETLAAVLDKLSWAPRTAKFTVKRGIVDFAGVIFDETDRVGLRVVAENVSGVTEVRDHLVLVEPISGMPILLDDAPIGSAAAPDPSVP